MQRMKEKKGLLMKHVCWMLAVVLLLAIGSAAAEETRIMVVSDLHYLAPEYYETSNLFAEAMGQADGKITMYSAELLEALLAEAREQKPDLLLITGDLVFNGERLSHQLLADALRGLQEEGIPVTVIPGNHDINIRHPYRYYDDTYEETENVNVNDFWKIWSGLLVKDMKGPGACGVVKVNDSLWIVVGDYSQYEDNREASGLATEEHFAWLEEVLAAAKEQNVMLIACRHQGMMPHSSYSSGSFKVWNGEYVIDLLKEAGCQVNLSGHLHIQHILRMDHFTDIATGSWSVSPHRYGIITIGEDGAITYQAHTATKLSEELREFSSRFFRQVNTDKRKTSMTPEEQEQNGDLLDYYADINEYYFAGTLFLHPELKDSPLRQKLKERAETDRTASYLLGVLEEETDDCLNWSSKE